MYEVPLERIENSINQSLQKAQDINAYARSKEEVSLLISRLHTKDQFVVLLRQIMKSDYCAPVLERKFALFCVYKMCEYLSSNIKVFVPKITKYICQRVKDNESLDDTAYNRYLVQTVSCLTKSLYATNQVTDIYNETLNIGAYMSSFSTMTNQTVPAPPTQAYYSSFPPLNCIITHLVSFIQSEDHKTNSVVTYLLCEVFYQCKAKDILVSVLDVAEIFYQNASKFKDRFVFKSFQVQLLSALTVLIQKFGVQILNSQAYISKYMRLIYVNLNSKEYQIRMNAAILLKIIIMQKILIDSQVEEFRGKIESMKRSDLNSLVRKEASDVWYLINQICGVKETHSNGERQPKMSFREFKEYLRQKNAQNKLRQQAEQEVAYEFANPGDSTADHEAPDGMDTIAEPQAEQIVEKEEQELSATESGEVPPPIQYLYRQPDSTEDDSIKEEDVEVSYHAPLEYSPPLPSTPPPYERAVEEPERLEIPRTPYRIKLEPQYPKGSQTRAPIIKYQVAIQYLADIPLYGVNKPVESPRAMDRPRPNGYLQSEGSAAATASAPPKAYNKTSSIFDLTASNLQRAGGHVNFEAEFSKLRAQNLNFKVYKQKMLQLMNKTVFNAASLQDPAAREGLLEMVTAFAADGYIGPMAQWIYLNSELFTDEQRHTIAQVLHSQPRGSSAWEDVRRLRQVFY